MDIVYLRAGGTASQLAYAAVGGWAVVDAAVTERFARCAAAKLGALD
jgi:hypothetical protein